LKRLAVGNLVDHPALKGACAQKGVMLYP